MRYAPLLFAALLSACGAPETSDDFSDLQNLDEKSDAFSYRMKIAGSLSFGDPTLAVYSSATPRYRAIKFAGNAGDSVDVWVRSKSGDATAWLLDNSFATIAHNDDASSSTKDAHLVVTLPASASATHYIVFREAYDRAAHFAVTLTGVKGPGGFNACAVDKDCIAVPRVGCCNNGYKEAVNVSQIDAYETSFSCPQQKPICPLYLVNDTRVAECNITSRRCEMVDIAAIRCGGFINNAHTCPKGYGCHYAGVPDVPGTCVADPVSDCRTQGCATGESCSFCWGSYACIPAGAKC